MGWLKHGVNFPVSFQKQSLEVSASCHSDHCVASLPSKCHFSLSVWVAGVGSASGRGSGEAPLRCLIWGPGKVWPGSDGRLSLVQANDSQPNLCERTWARRVPSPAPPSPPLPPGRDRVGVNTHEPSSYSVIPPNIAFYS